MSFNRRVVSPVAGLRAQPVPVVQRVYIAQFYMYSKPCAMRQGLLCLTLLSGRDIYSRVFVVNAFRVCKVDRVYATIRDTGEKL